MFITVVVESFRRFLEGADLGSRIFATVLRVVAVGASVYFSTLLAVSPNSRRTILDNLPDEVPL
ncbi:hypothetical protein SAMN05192561_102149 [Halopenitus malekzadehii]|uniref:Uncharacterized protein n=2 Tax=Halopenitus malekzadehii TaxID=1267564 RepID=A0A1H6IC41_9EURY|nr:hypothetical protein SAMN05192561_102149 [Halopenitus malekzadehii]